jgi:hypothetical protein
MINAPDYVSYQGYATLYGFEQDPGRSEIDMLEMLQTVGFTPSLPGSPGMVLVLDETCENRRDIAVADFRDTLRRAPSLWFKVWTHESSDLLCRLQRTGGWWCEYYAIGYLQLGSESLVEGLIKRFRDQAHGHREQLLIVDWQSRAEEVDWDQIWKKAAVYDGDALDVMGVSERLAPQFRGPLTGSIEQRLPGHRLLMAAADRVSG